MEQQKKNGEMPQTKKSKFDEMFTLVKDKNGVRIAVGNYQVSTKVFKNFADADAYIAKKPYEILVNVSCLFSELHIKNSQQNENNKEDSKNA